MLFSELEQLSVSLPMSAAPPMLSPFRPMLSPAHPAPFSVGRVVVQQSNLVFRTSKPAQKESAKTGRKFFYITGGLGLVWWWTNRSERVSMSNEINALEA